MEFHGYQSKHCVEIPYEVVRRREVLFELLFGNRAKPGERVFDFRSISVASERKGCYCFRQFLELFLTPEWFYLLLIIPRAKPSEKPDPAEISYIDL